MKIVIDIPNPPSAQRIIDVPIHFCGGQVVDAGGYGFEERKTGKWVLDRALNNRCSVCNRITTDISVTKPPFCQWCGAKMEVDNANSN